MATDREKDLQIMIIDKVERINEKIIKLEFSINQIQKDIEIIVNAIDTSDEVAGTNQNELINKFLKNPNVMEKIMELIK